MRIKYFIINVLIFSLVYGQYHISFGEFNQENKSLEIILENSESIGGFQFQLTGMTIDSAYGGIAESSGFNVSTSNIGVVIGFSFNGDVIPPGNTVLTHLGFSEITSQYTEFTNIILSNPDGVTIQTTTHEGMIDHGESDCSGSWEFDSFPDECGVCDGPGPIYDCGCYDIPLNECDCSSNVLDDCGVCGGDGSSCYFSLSLDNFNSEEQTVDVLITNAEPIMGFQFDITGLDLINVYGGIAEENSFTVSNGQSTVIGFSWSGTSLPISENSLLTTVSFSNIYAQFTELENIILSDLDAATILNVYSLGNINHGPQNCTGIFYGEDDTNAYGCCFEDIPDCLGICGGLAIEDECGVCNGDGYSCLDCFELSESDCNTSGFCDWETDSIECSSFSSSSLCELIDGCDWVSGGGSGGGYGDDEDESPDNRGYCSGGSVEVDAFCIDLQCYELEQNNCSLSSDCEWYTSDTEVNCINLPQDFCNLTNDCSWISGGGNGYGDGSYCSGDSTIIQVDSCGDSVIPGCTINIATNYNPEANTDDGSCFFPPLGAITFGDIDVWIGTLEINLDCEYPVQEFVIDISGLNITGCYGGASEEAGFTMELDGSTFIGTSNGDYIPEHSGLLFVLTFDTFEENVCFDSSSITTSANIEYEAILDECLYFNMGCTDIYALNYNNQAEYDDGSCAYADYRVETGMYYFDSDSLQIDVGESVQWDNINGFHSINGISNTLTQESFNNPEEFYLNASNVGVIGGYTFNIPGIYEYDCDVGNHAAQGMVGMLTVGQGGCMDVEACNHLDEYDFQLGECLYAQENYDCEGNCTAQIDSCGVCGGLGQNGDVNQNISLNIADITYMIEFILGFSDFTNEQICIGDINQDGILNVTDVVVLVLLLL